MHTDARTHLRKADEVMRALIDAIGPCGLRPGARGDNFTTLARAIVGQQLSARAAEMIWGRVCALHDDARRLTPADVLAMEPETYRSAGLSNAKVAFIKDLAARVESGEINFRSLVRRGDDDIVDTLVAVKGIGDRDPPWRHARAKRGLPRRARRREVRRGDRAGGD